MEDLNVSVLNIAVLGASGVGKSTFIKRFLTNTFSESVDSRDLTLISYIKTCDGKEQLTNIGEISERTHQHRARTVVKTADVFLILYTFDDKKSLKKAIKICKDVRRIKGSKDIPLMLVGNKRDSPKEKGSRSRKNSKLVEEKLDCCHLDASAKDNLNVASVFKCLVDIARMHMVMKMSIHRYQCCVKQTKCMIND